MEGIYGFHSSDDYSMSMENLQIMPAEYCRLFSSSTSTSDELHRRQIPQYGSEAAINVVSEAASITAEIRRNRRDQRVDKEDGDENTYSVIKSKITSHHPSYPKLLDAYIDYQKVGAPPEISRLLDEISRGNEVYKRGTVSSCFGADPDLDEFIETYCDILVKYKFDLARPFDEASMFLNKIETQLNNLYKLTEATITFSKLIGRNFTADAF